MDATQMINDSILESDEEENEENENKRGHPLAKLCILQNEHIPEAEFPLFLGDNVLGRDPNTCTLPLPAPSVSKQHATISISVYRTRGGQNEVEALVWDLGSLNGTRKGRLKLTSNVRYALSEGDSLVVADIPCQYVSYAADAVSSQRDTRTPLSKDSGGKAKLHEPSGEKLTQGQAGDSSSSSKKSVNRRTKARMLLPDLEDTKRTPARTSCLSLEQTPTQPQGTLVPDSDSDSDGERRGVDRRHKSVVSDSDTSNPTCSTFLSPTNKIVPESEDESSIIPSSSTKNKPCNHVSFSTEDTDMNVERQQLKEKKALVMVDDSEEEEGNYEERVAPRSKPNKSGQSVPVNHEINGSLTRGDKLPVFTPVVSSDVIAAFNMDSDTDVEEEERVASAASVTLKTNKQEDQLPNTVQFHMDSDTDADEDNDAVESGTKSVVLTDDTCKPPLGIPVIQPQGISMDSDTDDDVSCAATTASLTLFQPVRTADSAPSAQPKEFHLDIDTDVDEEEEKECRTNIMCSTTGETSAILVLKPAGSESTAAGPHSLHLESDTDDEATFAPDMRDQAVVSVITPSSASAGVDLEILPHSHTSMEDDSLMVIPIAVTELSAPSEAATQSISDADTDVDESSMPSAGDGDNPAELGMNSDTDVKVKETGDDQVPSLHRGQTPVLPVPLLQNCSTPVQLSEGEVEELETQAFVSPSSDPFRRPPAGRPAVFSLSSDSQEDEDFVVAETQSFILHPKDSQNSPPDDPAQASGLQSSVNEKHGSSCTGRTFQLELSDSSHLQCQAQALALASTQPFTVSVNGDVNLDETQPFADIMTADKTSGENNSYLEESTQAYGRDVGCSIGIEQELHVDLALQATQAYISDPTIDAKESDETQPLDASSSSTLAMAETQLMVTTGLEDGPTADDPISSARPFERKEKEKQAEATSHEQRQSEVLSIAETQPICISNDEESDDKDLHLVLKQRKTKQFQPEEETQTTLNSELSVAETQPMYISNYEESDEEDSIIGPRKRKAQPLQHADEDTQTLTNTDACTSESSESEACLQKQKEQEGQSEAETSRVNDEETPVGETQPMCIDNYDEDSLPVLRKRKAKQFQPEEEEMQTLVTPEVPAAEPIDLLENEGSDDEEEFIPGPRKRKAKPLQHKDEDTQPLTISSAIDSQPVETKACLQIQTREEMESEAGTSGVTVRSKRGARVREDEEEQAECSEPPKRQTKGKKKAFPSSRGRKRQSRPDQEESEEEEEAEQTRGVNSQRELKEKRTFEEQERKENEENERLRLEQERAERERVDRERKEQEEKEIADRIQKEKEQLEREKKEKERLEREKAEREEEKERMERERKEKEELEREKKEKERLELETAKREERARLEREEKERMEKGRNEKEMADIIQKEKERLERERKERERLELEKAEKERKEGLEREENERMERERQKKEEKERLEAAKRAEEEVKRLEERKEEEHQAKLQMEFKERLEKEEQAKDENLHKEPKRGRRATRRANYPSTVETPEEPANTTTDDCPARRTRSRSNSSNSISSERSASNANTQESTGRGRGRGAKRASELVQKTTARSSHRRRTVAAETSAQRDTTEQDTTESPPDVLSRSNSSSSLNSELSRHSVNSWGRGRGGRQQGRGRKTEAGLESVPSISSQGDQSSSQKATARGRKSRKSELPLNDDIEVKTHTQLPGTTTRGRGRVSVTGSKPQAADEKNQSSQEGCSSDPSQLPQKNLRGKGPKSKTLETPESRLHDATEKRGRKRDLETDASEDSSSRTFRGKIKAQKTEMTDEETVENPAPALIRRKNRATTTQAQNNANESSEVEIKKDKKEEEGGVEGRARSQPSLVQKKKKGEQEESGTSSDSSMEQDMNAKAVQPQTPTSSVSRKRLTATSDSSPVAKTCRSSSASPVSTGRLRAASQTYKVLFTGVADDAGDEKTLSRLGGSMAKTVVDMNCLVTDKVRRTVKFLCAVAKGVPIVTTHWLEKSGKAGTFLSPSGFVVKDPEQENKFNFCLQESLRIAGSQPLLQGYEIHVTKSVKPEPVHMKEIITCSGATFLPKMPSSHKPQTIVISCEEDWSLCALAVSVSLPVVTAEFILTGILQQKVDFETYKLSGPVANLQSAGGRGRGRKKT